MQTMWDLVESVKPEQPTACGNDLYDRFNREPDTMAIAVVDLEGRPLGLVERNDFIMKMASPYGRALYAKRSISHLMGDNPIIVEVDADVTTFTHDALSGRPSELLKGFLVTQQGRYVGVGSALSLLRYANSHNLHHLVLAEKALKARAEFLSVMSHEIRTPLNGVLGLAEIVDRQLQQETLKPHIKAILASGDTLLRLLNDALDFFRGDAGQLNLHEDSFEVSTLLEQAGGLWTAKASEAGLTLELNYDGPEGLWALGDTVRLKQVFNNLIGNALKFAARGVVTATLTAQCRDDYVELIGCVSDQGPGIAADRLATIFDPFAQTEEGRAKGGAGLGLSVCKQLLEQMHGSICAHSVVGEGSSFTFDLLLHRLPAPKMEMQDKQEPLETGGLHVLIADDNPTNRFVAAALCDIAGCTHVSVEDGAEAVAAVREQVFDLVLMDVMMPHMNGLEAVRIIRADPATAHLPVIALTANADPSDARAYVAAGMDAVVEKPIKPQQLFMTMERVVKSRQAEQVGAERAA